MKKTVALILSVAIIASLTACGGAAKTESSAASSQTVSASAEATTLEPTKEATPEPTEEPTPESTDVSERIDDSKDSESVSSDSSTDSEAAVDASQSGAWSMSKTVDEFGDITEDSDSVIQTTVFGDFSNTATAKSDLTTVVFCQFPLLTLRLLEYGDTPATFYDADSISMKVKINDDKYDLTDMRAIPPNSDILVWDDDQIILSALASGIDVRCIVYIDNSQYNFTIPADNFSELVKPYIDNYNYHCAFDYVEKGELDKAKQVFESLGDYENSAECAKECEEYKKAFVAYQEGNYDTAFDIIEKSILTTDELKESIHCIIPFIGDWTFLSGDNSVLTNYSKEGIIAETVSFKMSDDFGDAFSIDEAAASLYVNGKNIYYKKVKLNDPTTVYDYNNNSFILPNWDYGTLTASISEQGNLLLTYEDFETGNITTAEFKKN